MWCFSSPGEVSRIDEPVGHRKASGVGCTGRLYWEIKGVSYRYPGVRFGKKALAGVSMEIRGGEVLGVLGPNGSGKSTFLCILAGFLAPDMGCARFGLSAGEPDGGQGRPKIAYVPDEIAWPRITAREILERLGRIGGLDRERAMEQARLALEQVGLSSVGDGVVATFSRGMKQRLGIAQSLLERPDLLLLDEATSGLDPFGTRDFVRILDGLKREGCAVVLASHQVGELEQVCDRVAFFSAGRCSGVWSMEELVEDWGSLNEGFRNICQAEL
ncbi:MAG: ABC transporter ATP-binding protein [Puniceicoccaceae bacterium]